MTPREQSAFAGIEAARQTAMVAAITIEVRYDAGEVRQRAAIAALTGLAEGLWALTLEPSKPSPHCIPAVFSTKPSPEAGS